MKCRKKRFFSYKNRLIGNDNYLCLMQERSTREKILKNIRKALIHQRSEPFPNLDWEKNIYAHSDGGLEEIFASEFKSIGGYFIFCENEVDFLEQLVDLSTQHGWKKIICLEKNISDKLDTIEFH